MGVKPVGQVYPAHSEIVSRCEGIHSAATAKARVNALRKVDWRDLLQAHTHTYKFGGIAIIWTGQDERREDNQWRREQLLSIPLLMSLGSGEALNAQKLAATNEARADVRVVVMLVMTSRN